MTGWIKTRQFNASAASDGYLATALAMLKAQ
jgi:hypothetical protein